MSFFGLLFVYLFWKIMELFFNNKAFLLHEEKPLCTHGRWNDILLLKFSVGK